MNNFKFNVFYNNETATFHELMNKIFSNYVKQTLESNGL